MRPRRRRWPYVVIIVLTLVGMLLFIAQDPRTLKVESAVAASDPRFPDYISTIVNVPITRGDSYQVLQNGDGFYPAMLDAIKSAKRSIELEVYNYNEGRAGDEFTAALVEAGKRGVQVRLVLDAFGASAPPKDLDQRIEAAGGKVVWFNQFTPWTIESTNTRTHRKLLIIDGEVAFTGGAGIADHWLGNAQDKEHWRDTQFRVNGPAVKLLEACFYENWLEAGGNGAPDFDLEERPGGGPSRSMVIWSNPVGGVSNVKQLYLYSIAAARSTIDIQSPYFVPDASAKGALEDARRRGVRVRVLSDGEITDAKSVKFASRDTYDRLLSAGLEIYEYNPTMMHAKIMVIDGVWSVFGSGNFDNRSLELNDEITMAVHDAELGKVLTTAYDADVKRSTRYAIEGWRNRPWHWRVREFWWGIFGEVF